MALHLREVRGFDFGGCSALGAVGLGDEALIGFLGGTDAGDVRRALGGQLGGLTEAPGILLARVAADACRGDAPTSEPGLLGGRDVLFAFRGEETPEAARDWLTWHRRFHRADGALIFDTGGAAARAALVGELGALAETMEIVLIAGGSPGGPEAPPSVHLALYEVLRHRFLAEARAVAHLSIADLLLADREGTPFDRAAALPGEALALTGTEVFPWRPGQGAGPSHGDHTAVRLHETRQASSWCVAPGGCPETAVWRPTRIARMAVAKVRPAGFRRAMGVCHPGVPVGRLVRKSALVVDATLAATLAEAFGRPLAEGYRGPRLDTRRDLSCGQVTVVSVMKNEGPFILDWIAHHRVAGVGRFLVYTNDCEDGTDRLLECLADAGVLRRDNPYRQTGGVPQHAAFRAALAEPVARDADWLLTLDVDEYLNIRAGSGRIADLLEARPGMGAISIPWRLFGNADAHAFEDRPVTAQFTCCAPEYAPRPLQAWAFKTLYRNDGTFGRLGVHRPKALDPARAGQLSWLDGSGRPMPMQMWRGGWRMTTDTWGYDLAAINHYAVRSAESFLVKRERGRVNHVDRDQGLAYWFRMNHNVTEDRSIRRLDGYVAAERARLAALPGVAGAHESAVDWHRARIGLLRRAPEYAALYDEITGPRLEKLSRMTPNFGSAVWYAGPEAIPEEIAARDTDAVFYFNG